MVVVPSRCGFREAYNNQFGLVSFGVITSNAHAAYLSREKRCANAFAFAHDPCAFASDLAKANDATKPAYGRVPQS
jgi:hypothetical protein